ncbi:hypothetical protein CHARACLAT_016901 [Characodon lateralis]|uniref:Uncharacterized protein n=1 Tax=Characodon lateralis TaxID=208331 RepID=A0ABU7EAZ2_9TELE|nr:hypothetical protein [Characodon lateralis]
MMSCLWMCLSLLYLLQHSVSSDQAVSLICPKNLEVTYGETVTVNCSIEWKSNTNCIGTEFFWGSQDDRIECKNASTKYICDWDRRSYVFLNIFEVNNNTSVFVEIGSDCGLDVSPFITVNVSGELLSASKSLFSVQL